MNVQDNVIYNHVNQDFFYSYGIKNKKTMSIHIYSENYESGTRTDGVWNLYNTIRGNYSVISQSFNVQDIPWVFPGANSLAFAKTGTSPLITAVIQFPTMYEDDSASVIAWFEAGIATSGWTTCVGSYDSTAGMYSFTFDTTITVLHTLEHPSIFYVFDWLIDYDPENLNYPFTNPGTVVKFKDTYIKNNPKFLYINIEEADSRYTTDAVQNPTLLISTRDTELTDQEVYFSSLTDTFTISIYRTNMPDHTVTLTDTWELILQKK